MGFGSTLLKTVHTDWTSTFDQGLPYQVTTTLNDIAPNLVSKVVTTYDTSPEVYAEPNGHPVNTTVQLDNPTEVDEYGFNGSVARKTAHTWKKGGNYSLATGHILDRPLTDAITDPTTGKQSTTTYVYDTVGNATSIARGGTGTTTVTTQFQYNTHGDKTLITDPKLNQTTYSYANPWIDVPQFIADAAGCSVRQS